MTELKRLRSLQTGPLSATALMGAGRRKTTGTTEHLSPRVSTQGSVREPRASSPTVVIRRRPDLARILKRRILDTTPSTNENIQTRHKRRDLPQSRTLISYHDVETKHLSPSITSCFSQFTRVPYTAKFGRHRQVKLVFKERSAEGLSSKVEIVSGSRIKKGDQHGSQTGHSSMLVRRSNSNTPMMKSAQSSTHGSLIGKVEASKTKTLNESVSGDQKVLRAVNKTARRREERKRAKKEAADKSFPENLKSEHENLSAVQTGNFTPSSARQVAHQATQLSAIIEASRAENQISSKRINESGETLFQIPTEELKQALQASQSSKSAHWSHSLYRGPHGEQVVVHYCRSFVTAEKVAQLFLDKPILGFDIEWKPNAKTTSGIKNNVSLIQLATDDRIALFQLAMHKGESPKEILPPTLRLLLEDDGVLKAGVAIRADCTRLSNYLGVKPRGLMELSYLHNLVTYSESEPSKVTKRLVSLKVQVETHLCLPLQKGEVRMSDWSRELTHEQCFYAAADAYAGLRIYYALEKKRKALDPIPPRPEPAELGMPMKLAKRLEGSKLETVVVPTPEKGDGSASTEDLVDSDIERQVLSLTSGQADAGRFDLTDQEIDKIEPAFPAMQADRAEQSEDVIDPSRLSFIKEVKAEIAELDGGSSSANFVGRLRLHDISSVPSENATRSKAICDRGSNAKERNFPEKEPKDGFRSRLTPTLLEADHWSKDRIANTPKDRDERVPQWARSTATKSALRSYYLWEKCKLSIGEVAVLVRERPLQRSTVAIYIAECLAYEGLECSEHRRMIEVLENIPYIARDRYKKLYDRAAGRREEEEIQPWSSD
ncbi:hypothetical protein EJ08DRAFT_262735 [Tothia fuscella]|uniref:3'-5' exonuclease domain-containing protein n=1 Tax=Tothia fuscella TaxID=1048955 RepID=A0A9P4NQI2_9PEZI|nr:hypothetical protein EJ08DRAFT_262735 [Tothia fuscella]